MSLKLDEIYFCIFLRALASHGSFIIRHVPPGDYILRAVSAGYGPKAGDLLGEQKLRVGGADERDIVLVSIKCLNKASGFAVGCYLLRLLGYFQMPDLQCSLKVAFLFFAN